MRIKNGIQKVVATSILMCMLFNVGYPINEIFASNGAVDNGRNALTGINESTDTLKVNLSNNASVVSSTNGSTYSTNASTTSSNIMLTGNSSQINMNIGGSYHLNSAYGSNKEGNVSWASSTMGWWGNYTMHLAGSQGGDISFYNNQIAGGNQNASGGNGSIVDFSAVEVFRGEDVQYTVGQKPNKFSGTISVNPKTPMDYGNTGYTNNVFQTHTGNGLGTYGGNYGRTEGRGGAALAYSGGMTAVYFGSGNKYYIAGGGGGGAVGMYYGRLGTDSGNDSQTIREGSVQMGINGFDSDDSTVWNAGNYNYVPGFVVSFGQQILGAKSGNTAVYAPGGSISVKSNSSYYSGISNYQRISTNDATMAVLPIADDGLGHAFGGDSGIAVRETFQSANYFKKASTSGYWVSGKNSSNGSGYITCANKKITLQNPTRTGYTFAGWVCNSNASRVDNGNGTSTFTITGNSSEITALWTPITYSISYNLNGGSIAVANPSQYNIETNTFTLNNPTRTGYIFTGWTGSNGGTAQTSVSIATGSIGNKAYTANWTPIQYSIIYNGNGATGGSMANTIHTYDIAQSLRTNAYTRYAYQYTGWNTSATGNGIGFANGQSVLNLMTQHNGGYNLYAQWKLITHNITGTVSFDDQENKFASRPEGATVTLSRTPTTGTVTPLPSPVKVVNAPSNQYGFNNVQTYDATNGTTYQYRVSQNQIPGYETIVNGFNITNKLILPTYTSIISYRPVNNFQNKYLKNGTVEVEAQVEAKSTNRDKSGLNHGVVTYKVDSGIGINTSSIKITKEDGTTHKVSTVTNYTISGNTITIPFGDGAEYVTKAGDKLTIILQGKLNKIGDYQSRIGLTGKLTDYRGENTNIELGEVTKTTADIKVEYQMPKAKIQIVKKDSITEEKLTNATFVLYEWNGTSYIEKERITDTNADGIYESKEYEWNATTQGKYKVVEEGIPENHKDLKFSMEYTLNQLKTQNYVVKPDYSNSQYTIKYEVRNPDDFDKIDGEVENEPYKVKVRVENIDSQTKKQIVADSKYKIYEWNKEKGAYEIYLSKVTAKEVELTRGSDGRYLSTEWLYYTKKNEGKYKVVQEQAANGYYGDYQEGTTTKKDYEINLVDIVKKGEYKGQKVGNESTIEIGNQETKLENTRVENHIQITKVDSQTKKNEGQVGATVEGAIYSVYAKENIYHADGITTRYKETAGLLYKKDEKVTEVATDKEGKIVIDGLECGQYYIKEKTASEGYLLDGTTYEVDLTYRGEENAHITEERTLEEQVKKQKFQIYKLGQKEETEYEGLTEAGFTILEIEELSIVKEGKIQRISQTSYELKDEKAKKDTRITKKQNKDGSYDIKDLIDYYYKIEYKEGEESSLPGDSVSYNPYKIEAEQAARVKDYAKSQEGQVIGELRTNSQGYIESAELAYGEYIVLETRVPKEKEAARPFIVSIEQDSRTPQKLRFIIDNEFKARVKVYKMDKDSNQIVLKAGTKYVIRNQETGELQTNKKWTAEGGYEEEGTYENPYRTGNEGYFISPKELAIGKYEIEEVEAPNGYRKDQTKVEFQIMGNTAYYMDEYLEENVIVVKQSDKEQKGRIKVEIKGDKLTKVNKQNREKYDYEYEKEGIEGAQIQIIANERIYSQDGQGRILYEQGEVVGTLTTNEQGKAELGNLPIGKYKVKQVKAGEGYAKNEEEIEVEISYEGQDVTEVIREVSYENKRQQVEVSIDKKDTDTKEPIEGAKFGIYVTEGIKNKQGEVVLSRDEQVEIGMTNSEGKLEINKNLPQGKYYVKELEAATGYVKQEETKQVDGSYQKDEREVNKIVVNYENEKTKVTIEKVDKEGIKIGGATLQIVDKQTGEVVKEWETKGEAGEKIEALQTNKEYILKEKQPAQGYVTALEIEFTINLQGGTVQVGGQVQQENKIQMVDERTKVKINLVDEITKEYVSGATLQIVDKQTNEVIQEWETTKEGHYIEKLPMGEYTIREVITPYEAGYVTIQEVGFKVEDTKEIQEVTIEQTVSRVSIKLEDEITKEDVEGATLQVINKETGDVVRQIQTKKEESKIEKLPIGSYILKEVGVPYKDGYVTAEEVEFVVEDTRAEQQVTMVQSVSKIKVSLVDEITKEQVEGATLQIIKREEGKEEQIIREWETGKEAQYMEKVPVGTYILRESKAPTDKGYVTIEERTINIEDTREVQKIEAIQGVSKVKVSLLDEETKQQVEGAKLQVIRKATNEVVQEWETTKEAHYMEKLPIGEYILKEVETPYEQGYVTVEEIEFSIKDTREIQEVTMLQEYSKIEIGLVDTLKKEQIAGSVLQLIKKKEVALYNTEEEQQEEIVAEFSTKEEAEKLDRLQVGTYVLRQKEIIKGEGYVTTPDMEIQLKDERQRQYFQMKQEVSKVEIVLKDKDTKEPEEGATLRIINEKAEVVEEWVTGNKGHYIERLEQGKYTLEEVKVGEGKGNVTIENLEFEVKDTVEIQYVEAEQQVSKVEIEVVDKENKDTKIEGAEFEIIRKEGEQEEIITKITTDAEGKSYLERLEQGDYILRQTKAPTQKGYVKLEDMEFSVKDTREVQQVKVEQEYTKLEIQIIDKETKEAILGARIAIEDEEGKTIQEYVSDKTAYRINRLGVGKYRIVQKEAPTLKGYVKAEAIEIEIKETKEIQEVIIEEEHTKVSFKLIDEKNEKELTKGQLVIKSQEGKEIGKLNLEETKELERLPVGTYILESEDIQEGYQKIQQEITIEETSKEQEKIIKVTREIFDMQIQETIQAIQRNGETEGKAGESIRKVDIKDKKIKTEDIKVIYKIVVRNAGKVTGEVGKVEVKIPNGMEYKVEDNKSYWKKQGNTVIIEGLAGREMKEGAYAEVELILRWKNGLENFGTKQVEAKISNLSNKYEFEDINEENNKAKTEVIMGVGTGEVNLIWICIILLWILVPLEILITKKLRVKQFKIKDKSIEKYKK